MPVSAVLRESRITSTRGRAGASVFSLKSFLTSANAMPGVLELIAVVGVHALLFEYPIRLLQIEQGSGGDGNDELTVEGRGHLELERAKGIEPSS